MTAAAPLNQGGKVDSGKDKLDAYLDRINNLPPTPSLIIKLLALLKQPSPDIEEVVKLVKRDPALTTEVIKLCNSSYFRGEQLIAEVSEATARLGFSEVYRVIMMVSATRTISLANVESVLEVEALCRHAIATAVAAGVIAKAVAENPDSAFIAGLLHDVGKIALASAQGVRYQALAREIKIQGGSLSQAEKKNFGFDHSEVGSRLLERWDLPPEVVLAVRYHHNLTGAADSGRLTATVVLANMLAKEEEKKSAGDPGTVDDIAQAISILSLAPGPLSAVMEEVHEALKRDAGLLKAAPGKSRPTQ